MEIIPDPVRQLSDTRLSRRRDLPQDPKLHLSSVQVPGAIFFTYRPRPTGKAAIPGHGLL